MTDTVIDPETDAETSIDPDAWLPCELLADDAPPSDVETNCSLDGHTGPRCGKPSVARIIIFCDCRSFPYFICEYHLSALEPVFLGVRCAKCDSSARWRLI